MGHPSFLRLSESTAKYRGLKQRDLKFYGVLMVAGLLVSNDADPVNFELVGK